MKIPLGIHKPDADEGKTQVTGFLAMVPGEDAEAAAIDRNGIVQTELGGEIGNGAIVQLWMPSREPRASPRHVVIIRLECGGIVTKKDRVFSQGGQSIRLDILEQFDRVVPGQAPQCRIYGLKECSRFRIPTPP